MRGVPLLSGQPLISRHCPRQLWASMWCWSTHNHTPCPETPPNTPSQQTATSVSLHQRHRFDIGTPRTPAGQRGSHSCHLQKHHMDSNRGSLCGDHGGAREGVWVGVSHLTCLRTEHGPSDHTSHTAPSMREMIIHNSREGDGGGGGGHRVYTTHSSHLVTICTSSRRG